MRRNIVSLKLSKVQIWSSIIAIKDLVVLILPENWVCLGNLKHSATGSTRGEFIFGRHAENLKTEANEITSSCLPCDHQYFISSPLDKNSSFSLNLIFLFPTRCVYYWWSFFLLMATGYRIDNRPFLPRGIQFVSNNVINHVRRSGTEREKGECEIVYECLARG